MRQPRSLALLAASFMLLPPAASAVDFEVLATTGQVAPGLGSNQITISNFSKSPTVSALGNHAVLLAAVQGPGVTNANNTVLYLWDRDLGLVKLLRTGETFLGFAIDFLNHGQPDDHGDVVFTAVVDGTLDAIFYFDGGSGELMMVDVEGRPVSMMGDNADCQRTVPVNGSLSLGVSVESRRSLAFGFHERVLYPANVIQQSGPQVGTPLLWRKAENQVLPLANTFQCADNLEAEVPRPRYASFDWPVLGSPLATAQTDLSRGVPASIYRYDANGDHQGPFFRRYSNFAERELHDAGTDYSLIGGFGGTPSEALEPARFAVYKNDVALYPRGATPVPGLAGATVGNPVAQTMVPFGPVVFSARIAGGPLNNRNVVIREHEGALETLVYEGQAVPDSTRTFERIHTVHVAELGQIALQVQTKAAGGTAPRDEIWRVGSGNDRARVLSIADQLMIDGSPRAVLAMRTFGQDFVDPRVVGTGFDGIAHAFEVHGRLGMVVDYTGGQAAILLAVDDQVVSADGFENGDFSRW